MISSLQPQRPRVPSSSPNSSSHKVTNSLNQQQHRSLLTSKPASSSSLTSSITHKAKLADPSPRHLPLNLPLRIPARSQIEALSPYPGPSLPTDLVQQFQTAQQLLVRDSSRRHPVFFTERLKKAPEGIEVSSVGGSDYPITHGYVLEEEGRVGGREGSVKL